RASQLLKDLIAKCRDADFKQRPTATRGSEESDIKKSINCFKTWLRSNDKK
ncbi:28287_t:CDS:2, partial [Racocetra persica]